MAGLGFEVKYSFGVYLLPVGVGEGEVEVRAGAAAGVAGEADGVACFDLLPGACPEGTEVCVAGAVAVGVGDDHLPAAGVVGVGLEDGAVPRGFDFGACRHGDVDAVVEGGSAEGGRFAAAEFGGDFSFDGVDGLCHAFDEFDGEQQRDGGCQEFYNAFHGVGKKRFEN